MSLNGALTAAVTGLDAQARALGAISDNVANSSTVGYKRIETQFSTLLTVSNDFVHVPGGVKSAPKHTNDVQGIVKSSDTKTNLAVSGDGYFAVSKVKDFSGTTPIFEADPVYTRAGDFSFDRNGFLVNGAGYYLNGWNVDPTTGAVQKTQLVQIQQTATIDPPTATSKVDYSTNLPANPDATLDTNGATPDIEFAANQFSIIDGLGNNHLINVQWTKVSGNNNEWEANFSSSEAGVTVTPNTAVNLTFNVADNAVTGAQAGSILQFNGSTGAVGSGASLALTVAIAGPVASSQNVNFNLGKFGVAEQTTMFNGSDVNFIKSTQDGTAQGSLSDTTIDENGFVSLSFTNGARRTIAQVPLATFANYNGLQSLQGNAYATSLKSGDASLAAPGTNGAGTIAPSALENSNADIATEFTKMIQTQRAYSANTKVITTTNQMLEETTNMIR